jgi:hypothetical protein
MPATNADSFVPLPETQPVNLHVLAENYIL